MANRVGHWDLADSHLMSRQGGHYPAGTYVVLWRGRCTLRVGRDVRHEVVSPSPDGSARAASGEFRMEFNVALAQQTEQGIGLRVSSLDLEDPIREVRVLLHGGVCGQSADELDPFSFCETWRGGSGSCAAGFECYDFEQVYWNRFADSVSSIHRPKILFHPSYAAQNSGFRAIRFTSWQALATSAQQDWGQRIMVQS